MKTYTQKEADDLRTKAKDQIQAQTKSALLLAATLFDIYHSKVLLGGKEMSLVEAWKYDDFHEYAEHELGMHGSTAKRYVEVHDTLILSEGVDETQLPDSITKMMQQARLARAERGVGAAWLKKARDYSCCELEAAVDEELGEAGRGSCRHQFTFSPTQFNNLKRELRQAKDILGTTTNGETLSKIVKEWSALRAQTAKLRRVS